MLEGLAWPPPIQRADEPTLACLPNKNIIHSAKVASYFRRAVEFGITADEWEVDMSGVRDRTRTMVDELNSDASDDGRGPEHPLFERASQDLTPRGIRTKKRGTYY